jgi:alpha-tubulin suppressor-like RCC1 family protein
VPERGQVTVLERYRKVGLRSLALLLSVAGVTAVLAASAGSASAASPAGVPAESLGPLVPALGPGAPDGVAAWGENFFGQLGNGSTARHSEVPVPVSGLSGVTAIAAGGGHSLALLSNGTVMAWGDNSEGQLGNGTTTNSDVPVPVSGLSGVTAIAAGYGQSLALLSNGTVMAWGDNSEGQLGNGTTTNSDLPVAVSGLTGVTAIAGGEQSLALLSNGTVQAWGPNTYGDLGNGTTTNSDVPVPVSGLSGVTAIAAGGSYGLALLRTGTVEAWGYNGSGQLGNGSRSGPEQCRGIACSLTPAPVSGLSGVTAVAGGDETSLALLSNGTVMAWGQGGYGELGDGAYGSSDAPVSVSSLTDVKAIAAGRNYCLALLAGGTVASWGSNDEGSLGDGEKGGASDVPVAVSGLTDVTAIAARGNASLTIGPALASVASVNPHGGSTAGGTSVILTGTGFTGATAVSFGSTPAASFTVNSDTSITAIAPSGSGAVNVSVTTPGGRSAAGAGDLFTYGPTVTAIEPGVGPATGGTSVTITGIDLAGATGVKFGSALASSFKVNSETSVSAVSPPGSGLVDVTVTTPEGTSPVSPADQFSYAPILRELSPGIGGQSGGTSVTLTGAGFTGATAVMFGSTSASFNVQSDSSIAVTSPAHTGGNVQVTVIGPGGTSATSETTRFIYEGECTPRGSETPLITSVEPASGPAAGGNTVTIKGVHFFDVVPCGGAEEVFGVRRVMFGSKEALSFNASFSEQPVTAVAPPGTGTVNVRVETFTKSLVNPSDQYTYTAVAPTVVTGAASAVTPTSAILHATVNPNGSKVSECKLEYGPTSGYGQSAPCAPALGSGTNPVAVAASITGLTASTTYHFRVAATNAAGTSQGADETFTTLAPPAPTVTAISPNSGEESGGRSVTITGNNFSGAEAVKFGSVSASSFKVESSTSITAVSPPGKGKVDVTVTAGGATSATSSADEFRYDGPSTCTPRESEAPIVSSVHPSSGPAAGGNSVTITGSRFHVLGFCESEAIRVFTVRKVFFGSNEASSVTEKAENEVIAVAPPGTATVDVTVETFTTSKASAADHYTYTSSPPPAPTVTKLEPSNGPRSGGNSVTITGTSFSGVTAVKFGEANATSVDVGSESSITAVAPAGSGTVDVTVTAAGGTSATSSADRFTYEVGPCEEKVSPTVTAIEPHGGPVGGGTSVRITGERFLIEEGCAIGDGVRKVMFGEKEATSFKWESENSITAVAPPGSGTVDVTVVTSATSATGPADRYTYFSPPAANTHWYRNGSRSEEGVRVPFMSWGMLALTSSKGGASTECQSVVAGYVENPAGAAAGAFEREGVEATDAFSLYNCTNSECEAAGGSAGVLAEDLSWAGALSEEIKGTPRLASAGVRLFVHCRIASSPPTEQPGTGQYADREERRSIEYDLAGAATCTTGAGGAMMPKEVNGTSTEKPSKTEFAAGVASGELECGGAGKLAMTGNLKIMGYGEAELLSVKSP